jgi:T-complex protein 1 subunit beta
VFCLCAGFREAEAVAKTELASAAFSNAAQPEAFRQDLLNIARTTLSSKILTADKDHFAELAVDAITRLKGSGNLEAIHIIKKAGGALKVGTALCSLCSA